MSEIPQFASRFLELTDDSAPITTRARKGLLLATLSHINLAELIAEFDQGDNKLEIALRLRAACFSGQMKATLPVRERQQIVNMAKSSLTTQTLYYIHRDDARQYFRKLGLEAKTGTALHCWLSGLTEDEAKQRRPEQQDKMDFQRLCLDVWGRNPTMPITGLHGVTRQRGITLPYHNNYTPKTLEKWAREVAPDAVKKQRGRPPKKTTPP